MTLWHRGQQKVNYKCKTCGKVFSRYKSRHSKYCSATCMAIGMRGNNNGIRVIKWFRIKCNGPSCRGKMFYSASAIKKFCPKCHSRIKYLVDVSYINI